MGKILRMMKKNSRLRFNAIIFDMDGVITDTMPYHFDAWLKTFSRVGIDINCYDIYCREGQDGLTSLKEIFRKYKRKIELRQAKQLLAKKQDLFKRIVRPRFIQGARSYLNNLKKRKFLLGLVTGTSKHEVKKILPRRLYRLFDVIVTGSDINKGKPSPEPYLRAIQVLKISSRQAAVIENAPFGIQAAKKAGLFCVALETSLPRSYLLGADMVFKSFDELKQKLKFKKLDYPVI